MPSRTGWWPGVKRGEGESGADKGRAYGGSAGRVWLGCLWRRAGPACMLVAGLLCMSGAMAA